MKRKFSAAGFFGFFALFELTVYLTNDLAMPAMPQIVSAFHGPSSAIGASLALYVLGGSLLQVVLGPLAERVGERPVLLIGNALFVLATAAVPLCRTLDQFLAMRFIQGMGTCFVFLGYAVLHEWLDDVAAVRLTSALANVGILAPLIGPVAGSALLTVTPWPGLFLVAAALGALACIGLARYTPRRHAPCAGKPSSAASSALRLAGVLRNRRFLVGTLAAGLAIVPLTAWIGLSPEILLDRLQRTRQEYSFWQISIFSGFAASSILVQYLAGRFSMHTLLRLGSVLALTGVLLAAVLVNERAGFLAGMALFAAGLGLFNGSLLRLTMMAPAESTRLVAALFSLGYCAVIAAGLTVYNAIGTRVGFSLAGYALTNVPVLLVVFVLVWRLARIEAATPALVLAPAL